MTRGAKAPFFYGYPIIDKLNVKVYFINGYPLIQEGEKYMAGRPKLDNSRDRQYRVRLNEKENNMLEYSSSATGLTKSEIFRQALVDYYNKVLVNEMSEEMPYEEIWGENSINLKRVVKCPYCDSGNKVDFTDCCSETVDEDRQMGEEITYSFDLKTVKCMKCGQIFRIQGFICEYPPGIFNYEEINVTKLKRGG